MGGRPQNRRDRVEYILTRERSPARHDIIGEIEGAEPDEGVVLEFYLHILHVERDGVRGPLWQKRTEHQTSLSQKNEAERTT